MGASGLGSYLVKVALGGAWTSTILSGWEPNSDLESKFKAAVSLALSAVFGIIV